MRIRGQIIRVIRSYPGDWLAFALGGGVGSYQAAQAPVLVGTYTKRPSYKARGEDTRSRMPGEAYIQSNRCRFI